MAESDREKQQYDAWLHWRITYRCDLNCIYCFRHIRRHNNEPVSKDDSRFSKKVFSLNYPILFRKLVKASKMNIPALMQKIRSKLYEKRIAPINIPALINSLEKAKKTFRIHFTGGEPFLIPNLVDASVEITKKHFVYVTTNLITGKTMEFAEKINPQRVVKFTASLHIKELERLNLVDKYIDTYQLYRKRGFRIRAWEVAYPALLGEADKYKKYFHERGVELHFNPFIGYYNGKLYPESYTSEEFQIFSLDNSSCEVYNSKGKICNAGYNTGLVSPTGDIRPCYQRSEEMGNIYGEIKFADKLTTCPFSFCACPYFARDTYLFGKAVKDFHNNKSNKKDHP